jgi:hypothetical protein
MRNAPALTSRITGYAPTFRRDNAACASGGAWRASCRVTSGQITSGKKN